MPPTDVSQTEQADRQLVEGSHGVQVHQFAQNTHGVELELENRLEPVVEDEQVISGQIRVHQGVGLPGQQLLHGPRGQETGRSVETGPEELDHQVAHQERREGPDLAALQGAHGQTGVVQGCLDIGRPMASGPALP